MDSIPVVTTSDGISSRTASPARPKALTSVLQPRHNVTSGKRSDSAVMKSSRKKSPLPMRKSQPTGEGTFQGSSGGLSAGCSSTRPRSVSHSGSQEDPQQLGEDTDGESFLFGASGTSNDSSDVLLGTLGDETDFATRESDFQRTRAAIEHIQQKIIRTKELIKSEQTARDDNVNEYLKLASNADKQQLQRIKNVFEKKNQKAAQTIAQLQKKLENYNKRIKELEMHGIGVHRQPKEVLRDVGQGLKGVGANIRDGITGFSGSVMSKPREFAHLIKNKFGSADNINSMTKWFVTEPLEEGSTDDTERNHHGSATLMPSTKYASDDESSSITSGSGPTAGTGTMSSPRNQPQLTLTQTLTQPVMQSGVHTVATLPVPSNASLHLPSPTMDQMILELNERRDECQRLQEELESVKNQMQHEISYFHQALQEERYRYERLEEQMNDLIELHQNEIENLKQGISDMEEKVQYQSEERLRDMHEMLESCQTKISRMEHQQQQHQQLVTLEGIENTNARALVLKLINILLTVLQVVLLLVATAAGILMPFMKTRVRILSTSLLVVAIVVVCRQWPEVVDIIHNMLFSGSSKQPL